MKHTISRALGQVIVEERMRKGYSQSDLARLSGLHRSYIGDIERSARNISVENLTHLASALGLSGSALMRRMESVQPKGRLKKST